jgi:hypothetical protein
MSRNISESLGGGEEVCILSPLCDQRHGVWACAKFAQLSAVHRRVIAIARGICLICLKGTVRKDEVCRECGRNNGGAGKNPEVKVAAEMEGGIFPP